MKYAFLLLAAASAASARQPPVAVANSPPPIIAVPVEPPFPSVILAQPIHSGAPLPPRPRIVRPPQPRRPAQAYVTPADYPASALAQKAEGWVAFTLHVGANGRVTQCLVTGSSGWSMLDSATCAILRRRARFTPAADSNGNPVPWVASGEIEWRLPQRP